MMSQSDLAQIRNEFIKFLPQLLREEPDVRTTIEGIIAQQFPRKDEFVELLKEVKSQRKDMERHFVQVDKRINLLEQKIEPIGNLDQRLNLLVQAFEKLAQRLEQVEGRIDLLHEEMNKRFEQIERRFEQVDQRIDLLHEEMNKRFEQIERRFEQVDQRIDLLHEEMNKRFERVDQRFDKIDQRFEQVDQRFDKVDQRFEQMHNTQVDMKRDILKLRENQDLILKRMEGQEKWLQVVTGNMGTEKGETLEQLFAEALSYGLKNPDIKPESIRLNQKIEDLDGLLFKKPRYGEVDLIAQNGKLIVLEIKATAKPDDVNTLSWKVELLQLQNPDKQVQGLFIAMGASEKVRQRCLEYEIELVD